MEIPKFCKGNYAVDDSRLARWLRLINDINNEKDPDSNGNPLVESLKNSAKLCNFSENYLLTEAQVMTDRAYELQIERKEARAEGLKEGREKGLLEGREEGREEGRKEGRMEIAKSLMERGVDISIIAGATGFSEAEIRAL